jgi:hypothetical protein
MDELMLATDVVLRAIIGKNGSVTKLIKQAERGELQLVLPHSAPYWAVYSVNPLIRSTPSNLQNC